MHLCEIDGVIKRATSRRHVAHFRQSEADSFSIFNFLIYTAVVEISL